MGEENVGVVEQRRLIREEVIRKAREYAEKVKARIWKVPAVLVGSYARGDFNEWSDIDLLIVAEGVLGNPLKRMDYFLDICPPPAGVEPIILSQSEYMRQKRLESPLFREACGKGIVPVDDLSLFR